MNGLGKAFGVAGLMGSVCVLAACSAGPDGPRELEDAYRAGTELAFPGEKGELREGLFHVGNDLQPLTYEIVQGHAVHQGDIILGRIEDLSPMQLGEEGVTEAAVKPDSLWLNGVVPYVLDASLSDDARRAFLEATAHWEQYTALRFVPRRDQRDYVRVIGEGGCSSHLGRIGGEQLITLGPGCETMGIAAHEIGHAIGFYHEQSRSDRDQHVVVHWENIDPDYTSQFLTYAEQGYLGEDVGGYNVYSIMHYGSRAFSIDGERPTITLPDGTEFESNRSGLTTTDIDGATRLYGPPGDEDECGYLLQGDELVRGDARQSCDGRFVLIMQHDGNLVLYQGHEPLWATGTDRTAASRAIMQHDGNLVVYDGAGRPLWASNTDGHAESIAIVQDDGNFVVYDANAKPVWASNTCCR